MQAYRAPNVIHTTQLNTAMAPFVFSYFYESQKVVKEVVDISTTGMNGLNPKGVMTISNMVWFFGNLQNFIGSMYWV